MLIRIILLIVMFLAICYFTYSFLHVPTFQIRRLNGKIEELKPFENFWYFIFLLVLNIIIALIV